MNRDEYLDCDFATPLLAEAKAKYTSRKLAAIRAREAIENLGLEPLVRMADYIHVGGYGGGITMHFQDCVRQWLIPFLGESGYPWHDGNTWEVSRHSLWEWDDETRWGSKQLRRVNQDTACHVLTLDRSYLRTVKPNGRKKDPVQFIQLHIHQPLGDWINDKVTLPNGCVCTKSVEAFFTDQVGSCQLQS